MTDALRYPVGPFTPPTGYDPGTIDTNLAALRDLPGRLAAAVDGLDDVQLDTPYREGGWTVRQVVHHVADSHGHAYARTRMALTAHQPTIMVYDEKLWAELPDSHSLPVAPSLQLLVGLHQRWVGCLELLDDEQWHRIIIHPEMPQPLQLWGVAAMYDWHSRHHVAHITSLRDRNGW